MEFHWFADLLGAFVTESYLSDVDNIIVLFENTTHINQNKKVTIKERRAGWSD